MLTRHMHTICLVIDKMFLDVQHSKTKAKREEIACRDCIGRKAPGRTRIGPNAQEVVDNDNLRLFTQHWLKVYVADRIFEVPAFMPRPSNWFNQLWLCWARRQRHQLMFRRMKKKMFKKWLVKIWTQVPIFGWVPTGTLCQLWRRVDGGIKQCTVCHYDICSISP